METEEHCVTHWPFRSWCWRCVCGRAQGSQHFARSDTDRQSGRNRTPTISMDNCSLGSKDEDSTAHGSPCLVSVDNASEAVYAIACSTKACMPWVVERMYSILYGLGHGGIAILFKCDKAPEFIEARTIVREKSSAHGSHRCTSDGIKMKWGRAKQGTTLQGQFRTLKIHMESMVGELPKNHQVFQWMAWWAAYLLNRVAVEVSYRTVFEYATGHRMKTRLCSFAGKTPWRRKRQTGSLNNWDSERVDWIFLGISEMGNSAFVDTKNEPVKTKDYTRSPDGRCN